ncbi:MAG: oligopeptide:H+ symporter, partial [Vicinamibacterales bacterium]
AGLRTRAMQWGGAFLAVLVAVGVGGYTGALPVTAVGVADTAGVLLLLSTVVFFAWLFTSADYTTAERRRLIVVAVLFLASALFWSVFEQAGSTLNLFADRNTETALFGLPFPSSWFQSLNSFFIFALAPVFAWLWVWLAARGQEPSSPGKFVVGLIFVGLGFLILVVASQLAEQGIKVSPLWLTATYFLHTIGELTISPVGLSAMTRLAPARIAGMVMGVWFLGT